MKGQSASEKQPKLRIHCFLLRMKRNQKYSQEVTCAVNQCMYRNSSVGDLVLKNIGNSYPLPVERLCGLGNPTVVKPMHPWK